MNKTPSVLWLPVIAVIAVLLPAAVRGQGPADDVVFLDFLASDRAGQPVSDLSRDDVTLKVNGRVRPLLSLEYIGPTDIPREIVLLVDEPTLFGLEPVARDAVAALLASLPATDRVSYLSTRQPGRLSHQPGPGTALADLEAMQTGPGELWSCMPDTLRAIENIARLLPPGRGSALVVLTRGMLEDDEPVTDRSIGCAPGRDDLRQTQHVIATRQVTLLYLAVNHLTRSWGLDTVAANTGGTAGLLTWKDSGTLVRMLDAVRPFYRATFPADTTARMPQRVELSTSRRGVRITASPAIDSSARRP